MLTILAGFCLVCALLPAYVFWRNIFQFQRLPPYSSHGTGSEANESTDLPSVSVLIPARNEESSIVPCVESMLSNEGVNLEVVVLDDQSEDETAACVQTLQRQDERVRLESSVGLPTGWCGKQHACAQLAKLATHDILVFVDADVRLTSDALARMYRLRQQQKVDLLSGFPRQVTGTLVEKMLIPLMHFVLLGFLSLRRMRQSKNPAFGAGCGQLFMTDRAAYDQSGGHATIRKSLHDGLKLPRSFRRQGLITDVFDASDIATCRMYRNAREVWYGLKKNATEGIASAGLIVPVTTVLFCGQVLPFLLLVGGGVANSLSLSAGLILSANAALAWLPRFYAAKAYGQSIMGAVLHPVSIFVFLLIQWAAFVGSFARRPVAWKGRPYPAS